MSIPDMSDLDDGDWDNDHDGIEMYGDLVLIILSDIYCEYKQNQVFFCFILIMLCFFNTNIGTNVT